MRRSALIWTLLLACAVAALPAFAARSGTQLALVAYSTPKEAYKKIIPAFQATSAGKGVSFSQSYGASGDQARAVVNGLPADVVELSLEPDVTTLVKAGIVSKGDVLITYENEAILARKQGQGLYYIDPAKTILMENPVAITNGKNQAAARAFLRFLYTPQAQTLFAQTGYRPVVKSVAAKFK